MSPMKNVLDFAHLDLLDAAIELVIHHEGFRQFPYADAENTIAIGYGTNLTKRGITSAEAYLFTRADVTKSLDLLSIQPWWKNLNIVRQCVILDMAYAMGVEGVRGFHRMLEDLQRSDFVSAATEILRSEFRVKDPLRAMEDSRIMMTGVVEVRADE